MGTESPVAAAGVSSQGASKKTRGKGFPVMPLSDAVEKVTVMAQSGKEHPMSAVAGYLGHTTAASGPFKQKLAALRDWKLVSRSGEMVTITELGWKIAHPVDAEQKQALLATAFSNATLFKAVYDGAPKGVDVTHDYIGNHAVQSHGVSAKSRTVFINSFVESAVQAGLAEKATDKSIRLRNAGSIDETPTGGAIEGPAEPEPASAGVAGTTAGPQLPAPSSTPVVSQVWPFEGGGVRFEVYFSGPLPSDAFAKMAGLVTEVEALAEMLGYGADQDGDEVDADDAGGESSDAAD